jgi:hypothetical protein
MDEPTWICEWCSGVVRLASLEEKLLFNHKFVHTDGDFGCRLPGTAEIATPAQEITLCAGESR